MGVMGVSAGIWGFPDAYKETVTTGLTVMRITRHCAQLLASLIALLGVLQAFQHQTVSLQGKDVILRCEALSKPGVQYRLVMWYKVTEGPPRQLNGLVMKKLTHNNSRVEKYKGVVRHMELQNSTNLLLPNVTVEDSGIYSCFQAAPLGQKNQEGEVYLKVYEHFTVEDLKLNERDTIYMVAVTVLVVSLLMLCISYGCAWNVPQGSKKFSKDFLLKMPHRGKTLIVTLNSKHLVCKTLPEVFV